MGRRFLLSVVGSVAVVAALVSAFVLSGGDPPVTSASTTIVGPGSTEEGAADGSPDPGGPPIGGDGVFTIGSLRPVSGGPPQDLVSAHDAAVRFAIDDVNAAGGVFDEPIVLHEGDSGEPGTDTAIVETEALIGLAVDAIVGPLLSSNAFPVIERFVGAGGVVISPANTSPELTEIGDDDRYFRTAASAVGQGRVLASIVAGEGAESVSVIHPDDPFSLGVLDGFLARDIELGGRLGVALSYPVDTVDFTPLIDELVAEGSQVVLVLGGRESVDIVAAMEARGIGPRSDVRVWGTDANALALENQEVAIGMRHLVPGVDPATAPELFDRLGAAIPPDALTDFAPHAYDAVVVLALAASVAMQDDPVAIAAEINGITRGGTSCSTYAECLAVIAAGGDPDYDGRSGRLEFTDDGEPSETWYRIDEIGPDGRTPVDYRSG